jgi:hypothetical protein
MFPPGPNLRRFFRRRGFHVGLAKGVLRYFPLGKEQLAEARIRFAGEEFTGAVDV